MLVTQNISVVALDTVYTATLARLPLLHSLL